MGGVECARLAQACFAVQALFFLDFSVLIGLFVFVFQLKLKLQDPLLQQSNSGMVISSLRYLQSQGGPCHAAKLTLTVSHWLQSKHPWSRHRQSVLRVTL